MLGTIVNVVAVIVGTTIGCLLRHAIPEKIQKVIMQAIGLGVVAIGLSSAILTENFVLFIVSLALGAVIGKGIGIENGLESLGDKLQKRFAGSGNTVAEGFVTATLIFCVGSMTILGSIQSGLTGNHELLFTKSILDGIVSVILASTLGWGVGLSAIIILLLQGGLTLAASLVAPFMTADVTRELSAVGGAIIIGIGINLLDIKKIHVGDMLPAILIPPVYYAILPLVLKLINLF